MFLLRCSWKAQLVTCLGKHVNRSMVGLPSMIRDNIILRRGTRWKLFFADSDRCWPWNARPISHSANRVSGSVAFKLVTTL
jgi:hypothetical protein